MSGEPFKHPEPESLDTIEGLKRRLVQLQGAEQALRAARAENQYLKHRLLEAEQAVVEIRRSLSWRITAPMRRLSTLLRPLAIRGAGWVLFKPESRPRRMADSLARAVRRRVVGARHVLPSAGPAAYWLFVDHTIACPTNTGVQRIARGMAKALLEAGHEVRFVKWDAAARACVLIDAEERAALSRWNGPAVSPAEESLYPAKGSWAAQIRPARGRTNWLISPEVTHITFQSEPVTARLIAWAKAEGLKTGFVFYDAIPLRRPEFADMAERHAQYMRELRGADAIWPISRWSADELASFWGVDRDADHGYLPLVHPVHLPAEFDRSRAPAGAGSEKLVLCVGTIEPRKNQTALVRAFQEVMAEQPDSGWRLVLAGNLHPLVRDEILAAAGPGAPIEYRGHVTDTELSELYDRCAFTAFPSADEGFGLPILESLWQGKPCLCADFGAMGEVAAGGGCLTLDVRDPEALKAGLQRLMDDAPFRRELAEAAAQRPMTQWAGYMAELSADVGGRRPVIYYWVDSTVTFPANTGIQRVTRQLARGLIEAGLRLVPVKWGGQGEPLIPPTKDELAHFARWNGPSVEDWVPWIAPNEAPGGWFIMTELPLNLSDAEQKLVRGLVEQAGLRTAAVFHDTIPWKMRDTYPPVFANAHRDYMRELQNYTLVLPNSHYSRGELASVLHGEFGSALSGLGHITACPLAGEFPEAPAEAAEPGRDDGVVRILSVGTVEPRKNHERLLDAFELACLKAKAPLHLTIVGSGHSIEPDLALRVRARVDANPDIEWLEKADDELIARLYGASDVSVYPSIEEGFGMPILESLHYGKPVICADFGAMREVAEGGGCVMVDVRDAEALASAVVRLADSPEERRRLAEEAKRRPVRAWRDYAVDVAGRLGLWTWPPADTVAEQRQAMGLADRPRLSVCISTYNRASWLTTSLVNITRLYPKPIEGVEFVICDNASTDDTPSAVLPFLMRPDIVFRRNRKNVGMLGNLRETAQAARGDYIWILGDDDLLKPGAVERVLDVMDAFPDTALVYVNYAYTSIADARTIRDFDRFFFLQATPIVPPEADLYGPIREICARNENFFTAIYTLVFRRDHALKAYSQDTSGRPFSTMLTCIPTTHYVLNHMMDEPGVWVGAPQVVVNLNVSWLRYAPLWILERIPEVLEVAVQKGVAPKDIDRWRRHTLQSVERYFEEIYGEDPLGNAAYFSPARLVRRFGDLPEFQALLPRMIDVYTRAHAAGRPAASEPPKAVFGALYVQTPEGQAQRHR